MFSLSVNLVVVVFRARGQNMSKLEVPDFFLNFGVQNIQEICVRILAESADRRNPGLLRGAWSTLPRHGAGTRGWATWPLWPLWPEQAAVAAAACLTRRTRRSTRGTAVIVAPWLQQIHVV